MKFDKYISATKVGSQKTTANVLFQSTGCPPNTILNYPKDTNFSYLQKLKWSEDPIATMSIWIYI